MPIIYTCSDLLWQHKVQPSVQGKVFGIRPLISALPYPLGFLACGPLVDNLLRPLLESSPEHAVIHSILPMVGDAASAAALGASGALVLLTVVLLHCFDAIRNVERNLNDHVSLFGQVLIKLNYASEEEIDDALWWQQAHRRTTGTKAPLGQILVAQSVISPAELAMAESTLGYKRPSADDPDTNLAAYFEGVSPSSLPDSDFDEEGMALLGPILVELGYCDVSDLMRMYQYQHFQAASGEKRYLGELMLREKLISARELEKALVLLHERRKGLA